MCVGDLCHVPQGVYLYDNQHHFNRRTRAPTVGVYMGVSYDERLVLIFLHGEKLAVRKTNIYKLKEKTC
jgi:hypothetical protein